MRKTSAEPDSDSDSDTTVTDQALAEHWPMSQETREQVVKQALGLCGLDVTDDRKVVPKAATHGTPKPSPRLILSAMRVMATFDRLSIEQRKLDFLTGKSDLRVAALPQPDPPPLAPEIADKVFIMIEEMTAAKKEARAQGLLPEVVPPSEKRPKRSDLILGSKALRERWPLAKEARGPIIATALSLCGFSLTTEATIEPNPEPKAGEAPPKPRIVLAALRVLATYDRIAIEQRKIDVRVEEFRAELDAEEAAHPPQEYDMEIVAAVDKMVEEEERKLSLVP